jgi:hypothetical protein
MLFPHCHEGLHADASQCLMETQGRAVPASGKVLT